MPNLIEVKLKKTCDWNSEQNGWVFKYGQIPSAKLDHLRVNGERVEKSRYYFVKETGIIKWEIQTVPDQVTAFVKTGQIKQSWKEFIIPVLPAVVTGVVTYFITLNQNSDANLLQQINSLKEEKQEIRTDYKNEIDELEGEKASLITQLEERSRTIEDQKDQIEELKALQDTEGANAGEIVTLNQRISSLVSDLNQANNQLDLFRDHSEYNVIFRAEESTHQNLVSDLVSALNKMGFVAHEDLWVDFQPPENKVIYYDADALQVANRVIRIVQPLQPAFNDVTPTFEDFQRKEKTIEIYIQ